MSVLNVNNIFKHFPGTIALNDVTTHFTSGKVNALVGKNGSGKSTLVKIINGAYQANSGSIDIDGKELNFSNPKQANDAGIATVYQEMSLVPGLSVAENILIGRCPTNGPFVNWKETYDIAEGILNSLGIPINVQELVSNLSVWQCQVVEIAKAMSLNPKVILFDEPTSALAQHETDKLFELIKKLKEKDVIIIYISHRLQELWEIADFCNVLRDGKFIGTLEIGKTSKNELLSLMFGNVEVKQKPQSVQPSDEVILKVDKISNEPNFRQISFELKKGEVLGIAGMLGSGRTELLRAIFGADQLQSGQIQIGEKIVKNPNPRLMKKLGLAFIPEDRKNQGSIQIHSIKDNFIHASLDKVTKGLGFIDSIKIQEFSKRQIKNLSIKLPGDDYPMTSLSGGNQQKVVLGKWINTNPKVLLFDELSRGIDVNAKQQIFQIIWDLAQEGLSSIVVSSELEELLEICNRIIIMRNGEFVGEVSPQKMKPEELYALCMAGSES